MPVAFDGFKALKPPRVIHFCKAGHRGYPIVPF